MKFSCVFPGQGSQSVGMADSFMAESATKRLFEEANDTLHINLSKIMKEGDEQKLTQTENAQPALFLTSAAAIYYFAKQSGRPLSRFFSFAAGHSVGEYAAHYAAGTFSFADGLKLVRARGQAMASAVPAGAGGMAAVLGLEAEKIAEICAQNQVFVANDNAEGQVVISGPTEGLEKATEALKEAGARRVVALNVSAPFHSPLMAPAQVQFAESLQKYTLSQPTMSVVLNTTAQPTENRDEVRQELSKQIVAPVKWRESMQFMAENNINVVVEMGSGTVLSGLAKRCDKRLNSLSLNSPKAIDEFLRSWEQHSA